jgi:hypothetical protein
MSHRGIVVGLDDSRSARTALRWAGDYARRTGLALRAGCHLPTRRGSPCPRACA